MPLTRKRGSWVIRGRWNCDRFVDGPRASGDAFLIQCDLVRKAL